MPPQGIIALNTLYKAVKIIRRLGRISRRDRFQRKTITKIILPVKKGGTEGIFLYSNWKIFLDPPLRKGGKNSTNRGEKKNRREKRSGFLSQGKVDYYFAFAITSSTHLYAAIM
jgi:hypothetical protein